MAKADVSVAASRQTSTPGDMSMAEVGVSVTTFRQTSPTGDTSNAELGVLVAASGQTSTPGDTSTAKAVVSDAESTQMSPVSDTSTPEADSRTRHVCFITTELSDENSSYIANDGDDTNHSVSDTNSCRSIVDESVSDASDISTDISLMYPVLSKTPPTTPTPDENSNSIADDSDDTNYCISDSNSCSSVVVESVSDASDISTEIPLICPVLSKTVPTTATPNETHNIKVTFTNKDVCRKYDKKSYCYFCQKPQLKLARHLRTVHKCEEEVEKYINTNDFASKNQQLMKLRNMGNHEHNLKVIQKRTGELVVQHRPTTKDADYTEYVPCKYCFAYFVKTSL